MAKLIELISHTDARGSLTVIEKILPFDIKRVFYIYGADGQSRGGHRHKKTRTALICMHGRCVVETDNGRVKQVFNLDRPEKCLILNHTDWRTMHSFEGGAVLVALASEFYNEQDYIKVPYDSIRKPKNNKRKI